MTEAQSQAAQYRYQRESQETCPMCDGTGRIISIAIIARARKGGNAGYLQSLIPGQSPMSQRGKRGGRPKEPTLSEVKGDQQ